MEEPTMNSPFFGTESNLNGLPLTSKAVSGYLGQSVCYWIGGLRKSTLTRTIKASGKLPAGAGKYLPVTCGNRRQSLRAKGFACICG